MRKYIPGFEDSYLVDLGGAAMPRHIRMIEAEYTLTKEKLQQTEEYVDAVYVTTYEPILGIPHQIPYRIMVPKEVEGLLVAGKCVQGSYLVRGIPSIMAMGQAAGCAAALAAKEGVTPGKLDVTKLQAELRTQGVILKVPS